MRVSMRVYAHRNTHQEVSYNTRRRPKAAVCPSSNPTFLNTEDEDGTTLDHSAALLFIKAARNAGYDALAGGVDEPESITSGLDVAIEGRDILGETGWFVIGEWFIGGGGHNDGGRRRQGLKSNSANCSARLQEKIRVRER